MTVLAPTPPDSPGASQAYRDWKAWENETFGLCDTVLDRYFTAELARAGITAAAGTSFLEIGFGNGTFAAWANAHGCDYTGTELDTELVERARQRGWRAFPATLTLDTLALPAPPRCIVIFDVLEHLAVNQIIELLESAARVLPAAGQLVARLPSGDSPFARHIQHGDITHRCTLGSSAVRQLATTTGFDVEQIRAPVLPLRGVGLQRWIRRVPIVLARYVVARAISLIFHDNQPTVITANMLVVLKKSSAYVPEETRV